MRKYLPILIVIGASSCQSTMEEDFSIDKKDLKMVVVDVGERFEDYCSYFSVKLADSSFILTDKIVMDESLVPLTKSGKYLVESEGIQVRVFDRGNMIFVKTISHGFVNSEHEILFYSDRDSVFVEGVLARLYSKVKEFHGLDGNWFYARTFNSFD